MLKYKQVNNTHYWYNPDLLTEEVECAFDMNFWKNQEAVVGSAQGRGTTWFVRGLAGEFAIRHYRRGGLFGKLVRDSYLNLGLKRTRSYQELEILQRLSDAGVNVPSPVAAKVTQGLITYTADIITGRISGAKDLYTLLGKPIETEVDFYAIGEQIRKMHDVGVNHTDLNIHNILIDASRAVWIIDFDKCYFHSGDHWKKSNMDRLFRSFKKEAEKGAIQYHSSQIDALLAGYRAPTQGE
ncbi:3-deoxy-D-manno-octulosonic acid kinase [Vibrio astriarenae]|uniref:3-deoxy-D-manno-octulosonic acid kinase n=1 Tax=Vibrio astriarenae TaxID=1481923 RepID=A0A7Z2T5M0_9VIBR|nr:3-deoxy-D-manno-octulosonic acid kinase [Vibrio astriarenae]